MVLRVLSEVQQKNQSRKTARSDLLAKQKYTQRHEVDSSDKGRLL